MKLGFIKQGSIKLPFVKTGLGLLLALTLTGCGSLPEPKYPPKALKSIDEKVDLTVEWKDFAAKGAGEQGYMLSPIIAGDNLYAIDREGNLSAWNKEDGRFLWESSLQEGISSGLAFANDQLFVGTQNGELVSMSAQGGERLWRTRLSTEVLAAPQINAHNNQVIVQTGDGRVSALDIKTGRVKWSFTSPEPLLTLHGTAKPKVLPGVTFTGFANGRMVALDNRNGQMQWDTRVALPSGRTDIERLVDVDAQPLISSHGMLVSTSFQGRIMAMDPRSGRALWERKDSSYHSAVEGDGNLLYVDEASRLIAVDHRSGSVLWNQDALEGRRLTAPVIWQGMAVVADYEGYVHLVSARTGDLIGRIQADASGVEQPLIVSGDKLYITAVNGRVVALSQEAIDD